MSKDSPADGLEYWVVRLGGPEPPWRGFWDDTVHSFNPTTSGQLSQVPGFLVLKFREVSP